MSLALEYKSLGPVPSAVRARIASTAARLAPRGNWWAEGFGFGPQTGEGNSPMRGYTRLMLLEAPPETDMAMALRDATFIVRHLAWWSLRHGIAWRLSIEGHRIGDIRHGVPSAGVLRWLVQLGAVTRFLARTPVLYFLRRRALREYGERWRVPELPPEA